MENNIYKNINSVQLSQVEFQTPETINVRLTRIDVCGLENRPIITKKSTSSTKGYQKAGQ